MHLAAVIIGCSDHMDPNSWECRYNTFSQSTGGHYAILGAQFLAYFVALLVIRGLVATVRRRRSRTTGAYAPADSGAGDVIR